MQVVRTNEPTKILVADVEPGAVFDLDGIPHVRVQTAKTVVFDDGVVENVLAVNLITGTYLYVKKEFEDQVFCVPHPTAQLVLE